MRSIVIVGFMALLSGAVAGLLPGLALGGNETLTSGQFTGASGHITKGTVTIKADDEGKVAVLENNFNFDGAPDPKLGFGKDGTYDKSSKISHLRKNSGEQVYQLPVGIDLSNYNEFYVWCEKYNVPLGVAKLK